MEMQRKNKKELIKIIGLLLITLSSFFLIFKNFHNEKLNKVNEDKIEEFFFEEETKIDNNTSIPVEEKKEVIYDYNYFAVLEIPSINLKRGLVEQNSKYNNIKYNIKIIDGSDLPDVEKGNLILASHNGASYISYFKNLDKLGIGDSIYVYYDNYKYEYHLNNMYEVSKNGSVSISRDNNKTTITLITCKKNTDNVQTVYVGYLENKTSY